MNEMITKGMTVEKFIWVIKQHNCDPERLSRMSLLRDTKRVAYVLGVTRGTKPKLQLWKEIVATVN